ncbi:MAG: C-GCAxxG-C-C family protein [Campylobacter sp.]|nr:C-GCAxxG-C-C family protein [Campylobacter sp.]
MNNEELKSIVKTRFAKRNCAQIIFEYFGCSSELINSAKAYGGGFSRAMMCGSYASSLGVLGLYFDGEILSQKVGEFIKKYEEIYKSKICSEILGANYLEKDGLAKIQKERLFDRICVDLTSDCIEILSGLIGDTPKIS